MGYKEAPLPLNAGGTGTALTASNGGIFYSNATTGSILSGTATAGQILRSGATSAPTWSTATYPATAGANGNILTSDGTNWVSSAASGSGGIVKISSATANNSSAITFTGLSSTYGTYIVYANSILPVTDGVNLIIRTSTNNGVSYDSGAGNYRYDNIQVVGGSVSGGNSTSATSILVNSVNAWGNAADEMGAFVFWIHDPSQSVRYHMINYTGVLTSTIANPIFVTGSGRRLSTTAVNAIQFSMSSGNISEGQFDLYGAIA